MKNSSILQMTLRFAGLIQLILGFTVWIGKVDFIILIHILVGSIFTIALFALTYQAYRAGVSRQLVMLAAALAVILPIWGLAQEKILPESYFWISQVLHILFGVGAIGMAEMMAVKMRKLTA